MPEPARFRHVLAALVGTPWAIEPEVYRTIREVVAVRLAGERFSAEEIEARVADGPGRRRPTQAGAVALIPLAGPIFPKANLLTAMSGATALSDFGAAIDAAANDPSIGSILLDVDSPGGSTDLVPETAAKIRAARERKRVVAVANTKAASAAYWLASQADELVVTPSGLVGSIGVFAEHHDHSRQLDAAGVDVTLVKAGRFKAEGHPALPLDDDARANLQSIVDHFYGLFTADVAKGRGVKASEVRDGFGEGRVVTAREAFRLGMVDRIETFDAALARVAGGRSSDRTLAAETTIVINSPDPEATARAIAREIAAREPGLEPEDDTPEAIEATTHDEETAPAGLPEGLDFEVAYEMARARRN